METEATWQLSTATRSPSTPHAPAHRVSPSTDASPKPSLRIQMSGGGGSGHGCTRAHRKLQRRYGSYNGQEGLGLWAVT